VCVQTKYYKTDFDLVTRKQKRIEPDFCTVSVSCVVIVCDEATTSVSIKLRYVVYISLPPITGRPDENDYFSCGQFFKNK